MKRNVLLVLVSLLIATACRTEKDQPIQGNENPPATGFNMDNSDPAAIELADSIMAAMGGRQQWDATRFISWDFGNRKLVWDKQQDRVRIESLRDTVTYLVNLNTLTGRVNVKGQELTEPDSLSKMLTRGKSMWINDSYWLLMPFKLKDSGVTLKYIGEDSLRTGGKSNVLELTFDNVGDTPQNKYLVYVDLADNLVKQWAYYREAAQDSANFVRPWDNYQRYGGILLSADRSDGGGPKNVQVHEVLPEETFTQF
jgi:hypothetical protein